MDHPTTGGVHDAHEPTRDTNSPAVTSPPRLMEQRSVTIAGTEHPNQDLIGSWGDVIWVIDGASRPTSPPGTVETYVQNLSGALEAATRDNLTAPLADILAAAITATTTEQASATIAMARATTTGFDYLVLGDAHLWTDPTTTITDDRLAHIATTERAQRSRIRAEQGPGEAYREATAALLAVEDAARNQPSGFWVAGADPEAAFHAITGNTTAQKILLASDGLDPHPALDVQDLFTSDPLTPAIANARAGLTVPIDDITVIRAVTRQKRHLL